MLAPTVESMERTGAELLERARRRMRARLEEQVSSRLSVTRREAGYHLGWLDADGRPAEGSAGKAVRPALCFAAAEAVGTDAQDAVPAAMAVQLVHEFSLLHDDIIDGDRTRRHRPAVWAAFGTSAGVLCGDALLSLAHAILAAAPTGDGASLALAETVVELVEGEALDVAFERRDVVRPGEYVAMASAKTGALMDCACRLGALAGAAAPQQAKTLGGFGRHLGIAFQITDDLLGLYGDEAVTGKPVGSDLAARKKTLPVLAALASPSPAGTELARLYAREDTLTAEETDRAVRLVEEAGGAAAARREAERELLQAQTALADAAPTVEGRRQLMALAHLLTHRES
ncbi:polyprenyl synthetase family protein [Streptomyces sp. NPDC054796]